MKIRLALGALLSSVTVLLSCGGGDGPTGPVAIASIEIADGLDTLVSFGQTRQFTAVVKDASGNVLTGRAVTWSTSAASVATVNASSGLATAVGNGNATITASADGVTGTAPLSVVQLVTTVAVSPSTQTIVSLGATQQYTANATDGNGNPVAGTKILWLSANQSVATVDTTGLATARGSGQTTITAAVQGTPGNAVLTVTQTVSSLAFRVSPPTSTVAGEPFASAVQVEARDAGGAVVRDAQIPITLAASSGTLKGTRTVNAINGVASFSGLYMETTNPAYTLTATSSALTSVPSAAFAITHAAPVDVAYSKPPANDTAGAQLGVIARIRDRFGNTATSSTDFVRLYIVANPGGISALSGDTIVQAVNGVATFTGPRILRSGNGLTLRARATGLDSTVSAPFNIAHATPHHLGTSTVSIGTAGQLMLSLEAYIWDQFDNVATTAPHQVTMTVDTIPFPPASITGALTVQAVDGFADYALTIDRPSRAPNHYALSFSAPGLATIRSHLQVLMGPPTSLAAGAMHTCAVIGSFSSSRTFCWGSNLSRQLGNAGITAPADSAPVPSATGQVPRAVSGGDSHTCLLNTGDQVYCWGNNEQGQLGRTGVGSATPNVVSGAYYRLASGGFHTCGLRASDSTAYCWGDNQFGQLGDDAMPTDQTAPVAVAGARKFIGIAAGRFHTCGIQKSDSTAFCWGFGTSGQLGNSGTATSDVPVAATGGLKFLVLALGDNHTCGVSVTAGLQVYCWGSNQFGQLGVDAPNDKSAPTLIPSFGPHATEGSLAAGAYHTCARTGFPASVYCWGLNGDGQSGPNAGVSSGTPVLAFSGTGHATSAVVAGRIHTCVLVNDALDPFDFGGHCWGRNAEGQLGIGSTVGTSTPTRITR